MFTYFVYMEPTNHQLYVYSSLNIIDAAEIQDLIWEQLWDIRELLPKISVASKETDVLTGKGTSLI